MKRNKPTQPLKVICEKCVDELGLRLKENSMWLFNEHGLPCFSCGNNEAKIILLKFVRKAKGNI